MIFSIPYRWPLPFNQCNNRTISIFGLLVNKYFSLRFVFPARHLASRQRQSLVASIIEVIFSTIHHLLTSCRRRIMSVWDVIYLYVLYWYLFHNVLSSDAVCIKLSLILLHTVRICLWFHDLHWYVTAYLNTSQWYPNGKWLRRSHNHRHRTEL